MWDTADNLPIPLSCSRLSASTPMYDMLKLFRTGRAHMALLTQPLTDEVASQRGTITAPNSAAKPPDTTTAGGNTALVADGGSLPHRTPPHQKRDHGDQPGSAQHHRKDGPVSGYEPMTPPSDKDSAPTGALTTDSAPTDVLTALHHHHHHLTCHTPDQPARGGGPPSDRGTQSMGNLGEITPPAPHLHHAASVDAGSTCGEGAPSSVLGRSHSVMRSVQTFFKRWASYQSCLSPPLPPWGGPNYSADLPPQEQRGSIRH